MARRGTGFAATAVSLAFAWGIGLTLTGCGVSGALDPPGPAPAPHDDLAVPAETVERSAAPTGSTPAALVPGETATPRTRSSSATSPDAGGKSPKTRASDGTDKSARWETVLRLADASGDLGVLGGPDYADLTGLRIDNAGGQVRLTISMTGDVPRRLADGEVVGIGIDIYRSKRRESDYQVFLDGGDHGWRAYLQTPRGFVRFPGTFAISDRRMIIELPWSSLGGSASGRAAGFADFSGGDTLRSASQDRIPDSGTRRF